MIRQRLSLPTGWDRVYVNTANPGEVLAEYAGTTWPADNVDSRGSDSFQRVDESRRNPYGHCTTTAASRNGYTNDLACSWRYGCNRAVESVDDRFVPAARAAGVPHVVWADVTLAVGALPHRVLHGHRESR